MALKTSVFMAILFLGFAIRAQSQAVTPRAQATPAGLPAVTDERLLLAASESMYPVTPGDVYRLTLWLSGQAAISDIIVGSDWVLNLGIFGKLDAKGMLFSQIKPIVEKMVINAYPKSTPSTTIVSVGVFQVPVTGEIPQARLVNAWGLSRLSELVDPLIGPYSSIRDVEVRSAEGTIAQYDLFKAATLGILDQDPILKPGDRIVIRRVERQIELSGEVLRPGRYQLSAGEGLQELSTFAGGFTSLAERSHIRIDRQTGDRARTFSIDFDEAVRSGLELKDRDKVSVPAMNAHPSAVFFEGAVLQASPTAAPAVIEGSPLPQFISGRLALPVVEGEMLSRAMRLVMGMLSPLADLSQVYIIRLGAPGVLPVDCEKLLYDPATTNDLRLEPFDRIVIPAVAPRFVLVTGAVFRPGAVAFRPDKPVEYYINLAGGIDSERNTGAVTDVFDSRGHLKAPGSEILLGDTINVPANSFFYNFNKYLPLMTASVTFITAVIGIVNLLR